MRSEGFRGLLGGLGRFAGTLTRKVYRNERFRLYELRVDEAGPILLSAPFEGVEIHAIETREEAHRLMAQGYEDVVLADPHLAPRLDSGAVALCAFVNREFASIDFMAFSEEARRSFDKLPCRVEFENGDCYTGGAFTVRRLRGKGVATYRMSWALGYLRDRGCHMSRCIISDGNVPSQRTVERFGGSFSKVRHLRRVLWWTRWTETPVA
ncbi:MAG: hypothetical protein KAQ74_05690 [Dehalococcoidia bacterium]|nr:hypothetical protein [Dehalococcoidia bacterium]